MNKMYLIYAGILVSSLTLIMILGQKPNRTQIDYHNLVPVEKIQCESNTYLIVIPNEIVDKESYKESFCDCIKSK